MTTLEHPGYLKTPEEYLAAERIAEQRHEYLAGAVYAIVGATADHRPITMNICRHLGNQLQGKRCEVFSSDVKVRIRKGLASFFIIPMRPLIVGVLPGIRSLPRNRVLSSRFSHPRPSESTERKSRTITKRCRRSWFMYWLTNFAWR